MPSGARAVSKLTWPSLYAMLPSQVFGPPWMRKVLLEASLGRRIGLFGSSSPSAEISGPRLPTIASLALNVSDQIASRFSAGSVWA